MYTNVPINACHHNAMRGIIRMLLGTSATFDRHDDYWCIDFPPDLGESRDRRNSVIFVFDESNDGQDIVYLSSGRLFSAEIDNYQAMLTFIRGDIVQKQGFCN